MPYVEGRRGALDRVRGLAQDVHPTELLFEDGEIKDILSGSIRRDFLEIYNDLGLTGAATATFQVQTILAHTLTLTVKNAGGAAIDGPRVFDLEDDRYDSIRELIDVVNALGKGWHLDLYTLDIIRAMRSQPISSVGLEIKNEKVGKMLNKRSWDLVEYLVATDASGLSAARRVGVYNIKISAREALIRVWKNPRRLKSYKEGAIAFNREDLKWRIDQLGRKDPIPAAF